MISLLLILVAVALLVLGLTAGSSLLLTGSIAASLLAAVALMVGARQASAARTGGSGTADPRGARRTAHRHTTAAGAGRAPQTDTTEAGGTGWRQPPGSPASGRSGRGADLAGEPPEQPVSAVAQSRLARLETEVYVVDGRPRYHLADCGHLRDRQTEGLPVAEAAGLGFSPCGWCRPVTALLGEQRPV